MGAMKFSEGHGRVLYNLENIRWTRHLHYRGLLRVPVATKIPHHLVWQLSTKYNLIVQICLRALREDGERALPERE